jgi:hypothetical protein
VTFFPYLASLAGDSHAYDFPAGGCFASVACKPAPSAKPYYETLWSVFFQIDLTSDPGQYRRMEA